MKVECRKAAIGAHLPAGKLPSEGLSSELGDWTAERILAVSPRGVAP